MNENLQNAVTELITKAISTADHAQEFVMAEMPELIQQLLYWKMIEAIFVFILSIIWLFAYIKSIKWIWPKLNHKVDCLDAWAASKGISTIGMVIVGSLVIINLTIGIDQIFTILQIWIAPKVYLIEYASGLIK